MTILGTTEVDGMVSIDFEMTDGVNTLKDAIVVTQAQYDQLTPADIEAIEQQRWDNWLAIINNPTPTEWLLDADGNNVLDEYGNPIVAGE